MWRTASQYSNTNFVCFKLYNLQRFSHINHKTSRVIFPSQVFNDNNYRYIPTRPDCPRPEPRVILAISRFFDFRFTVDFHRTFQSKYLPNMNTFCDWLSETIMNSVYDSFFRNYISIDLFKKYRTFSVLIYSYINTSGNWKNEKLCENTTPAGRSVFT